MPSIRVKPAEGQHLKAPVQGPMNRFIKENPWYAPYGAGLLVDGKLIFDHLGYGQRGNLILERTGGVRAIFKYAYEMGIAAPAIFRRDAKGVIHVIGK